MKKMLSALLCVCAAVLMAACGDGSVSQEKYDSVVAERDALEAEIEGMSSEDEGKIILEERYDVDGDTIILWLKEQNNERSLNVLGRAKDEEKGSLMAITLRTVFDGMGDKIDAYIIDINVESEFVMYTKKDGMVFASGKDRDGSTTFSMPDWCASMSDCTMPKQEINEYMDKIMDVWKEFREKMNELL